MHSNSIDNLIKAINLHLYDLDRVINGILETMPYFDFKKGFENLINEVSKKENFSVRNLDILWEYLFISQALEFSYKKWDIENYNSNPNYEIINFPPEYKQAGISILSYFNHVLIRKYPDMNVGVSIEQDGDKVTLIIETPEGDRECIEK